MPDHSSNDRRAAILAAAERVFQACGFAATTMEAVACEAGVAKGSLYNYFHNKHELFSEVFLAAFLKDREESEQALAGAGSPRAQVIALFDRLQDRLEHYRMLGRLMLEFRAHAARDEQEGEWSRLVDQLTEGAERMLADIIRRGIALGEFSPQIDPDNAARIWLTLTDGIVSHSILRNGVTYDADFFDGFKRGMLAVLRCGFADDDGRTADAAARCNDARH